MYVSCLKQKISHQLLAGGGGGEVQLAIYNSLANKLLKLIGDHNPFDPKMW